MSKLIKILLLQLFAIVAQTDGHFYGVHRRCLYSSEDLHDMVFIDSYMFNQVVYLQYNSTIGKFVGYTELGIKNAVRLNNIPEELQSEKANLENFCKYNAKLYYPGVYDKTVAPYVKVKLVKKSDGSHPAMLMCSAYNFYPTKIEVTWLRDGKVVEGGVTSTEEMADGDWYYQIHSHLEYMPKSGEEITCMVQHASFQKPMIYPLDPSVSESDKSKTAIGASGLVLGIILSAAGFIYYKKKSSGRILVPT
ncbi:DLA class II histocompatibility antigen, DR-1 beta chain-like [Trichomycterus rosablanca]|uniref:DLA class II histocompatibility antigen, DR-1 beta chain-like n=1 Tax=Trichomycterus rosablanca TaxID=2290929 RepID=UPI002F34F060